MNDVIECVDKELVGQRFRNSVSTYDANARVQKAMAIKLAKTVGHFYHDKTIRVLEVGCGTGNLTREIMRNINVETYFANDLVDWVEPVVTSIAERANVSKFVFHKGDAEKLHFPGHLDLVCSGAVFQWFEHKEMFFKKASESLNDQGVLAFSTFGTQNYREIRQLTGSGLTYYKVDELMQMAAPYFSSCWASEWVEQLWFNQPSDVLKHMKHTGVGGVSGCYWSKSKHAAFESGYQQFASPVGNFPLTYHPQLLLLRKL
jgi:malonyl-ACP O-methyltransferase BioC